MTDTVKIPEPVELNPAANSVVGFSAEQMKQYGDDRAREALEKAAKVCEAYAPNRPIVSTNPSPVVIGRWEGEQAASSNISRHIRALAKEIK